jgi:hypothetical protein
LTDLRLFDRQAAEYERPGSKPEFLGRLLALQSHASNRLGLTKLLLGDEQLPWKALKDCSGRLKASIESKRKSNPIYLETWKA